MAGDSCSNRSGNEIESIDDIVNKLGGCGLFQFILVILLHGSIIASPWAMMFMVYGSYNPGWMCSDPGFNSSSILHDNNTAPYAQTNINTSADDEFSKCETFGRCKNPVFSTESSTVVTEWSLLCDRHWIITLLISLQMGGVLVGSLSAGQLNLMVGRKVSHYGTLVIHASLNLIASFSVNWQMLAACRFFIGVTCGSIILSGIVYPLEFVNCKWRAVVASLPVSVTGSVVYALVAMWLKDWRLLLKATAILTVILTIPAVWIPDSVRWLALKDKIPKAVRVVKKIAKTNRKPLPDMKVIVKIAEREKEIEKNKPNFTMLDLYRHGLLRITLTLTFTWVTYAIVYYTFLYDVKSLSGNFFINFIIFALIPLIGFPLVPALTNTIGRKWGIIVFTGVATLLCAFLFILNFTSFGVSDVGLMRLIIVLLINIFVDGAWAIVQLICVELYPTILRSLSFSHSSSIARIGGMLAPMLIPRDPSTAYISQLIILIFMLIACTLLIFLPESKDHHLAESVNGIVVENSKDEEIDMIA